MPNRVAKAKQAACAPKPALGQRPPITAAEAEGLERLFKVLANATRLQLLHTLVLRPGIGVTELADAIGMTPQAISNQLQRLADKGILTGVRDGTNVRYRVIDPCVLGLLDQGLCLAEDTWTRQDRLSGRTGAA
jgi:ArsR family transcriptional regulator, lead/cadmium/zinc/bismuth-responsive transcriptional repressor